MKAIYLRAAAPAAALVFAAVCASPASARCVAGPRARGFNGGAAARSAPSPAVRANPAARPAAPRDSAEPSIVGYWYVRFTSGATLIDDGFDLWTSDGLEILNDSVAPSQGAVCVGVWTRFEPYEYILKHPTWIFDEAGVNLVGVAMIGETVTLDSAGQSFTGTSTVDVYDMSGNLLDHEVANVTGVRIQARDLTPPGNGIPGLPPSIVSR